MLEDIAELAPVREKQKALLSINRAFAMLWRGRAISTPGTSVLNTTLVPWIATASAHHASRAPLAVRGAFLAASVPPAGIGLLAEAYVDRREKRWTLALRAVLTGLPFLLALTGNSGYPTWFLLTMSSLIVWPTSSCSPFFGPARLTVPVDLVDEQSSVRPDDSTSRWAWLWSPVLCWPPRSISARVRKVPFDRCASCSAESVFYGQYSPDHALPGDLAGDAGSRISTPRWSFITCSTWCRGEEPARLERRHRRNADLRKGARCLDRDTDSKHCRRGIKRPLSSPVSEEKRGK